MHMTSWPIAYWRLASRRADLMVAIIKPQSYACRCKRASCQSRHRLPRHPDKYIRPPRCRSCNQGTYRIDKFRTDGREQRGNTCRCDGYSFPHFRGRGYCHDNPNLTADIMRERYESGSWA